MLTPIVVVYATILVPVLFVGGLVWSINRRHERFINPLTKSLRRPPGTQLGRQLSSEQFELGFSLVEIALPGVVPLVTFVYASDWQSGWVKTTFVLVVTILWLAWVFYAAIKFVRRVKRIKSLRLGYECELAVGQELDLLMMSGFRVFHDVPAGNFNIDHIVVGPPGIFAVETKGRSKTYSENSDSKKQFRVSYSRGVLEFPNGYDKDAVPQAVRQASWVSQWLSQATGEVVSARPVVVLPGWYVEIKDKPAVPVIASGFIQGYFLGQSVQILSEKDVSRIAYQIDQKVRDLAPGEIVRPLAVAG